jgi:hypothetical protein
MQRYIKHKTMKDRTITKLGGKDGGETNFFKTGR